MENEYLQELIKGCEKQVLYQIREKINHLKSTREALLEHIKN